MQELVEIIRRDHAVLHDLARDDADGLGQALQDHLAFLDVCVGPAVEGLGPLTRAEWAVAREGLVDARELAGRPVRGQLNPVAGG